MEIGIRSDITTYSSRLGVLAGDSVASCVNLRNPLVAVIHFNRKGYLRLQMTEWCDQIEHSDDWASSEFISLLPDKVTLRIEAEL